MGELAVSVQIVHSGRLEVAVGATSVVVAVPIQERTLEHQVVAGAEAT